MKSTETILFRGLALAALADWLIGRTFTRGAVYMPKSPSMIVVFQALGVIGQFAFTLTGLLAVVAMGWLAWRMRGELRGALSLILAALLALSLLSIFVRPSDWSNVVYHLLVLVAFALVGATARESRVWMFPGIALGLAQVYQASAALSNALYLSEPLPFTLVWFALGEFFVVASGFGLWWFSARRRAAWWMWGGRRSCHICICRDVSGKSIDDSYDGYLVDGLDDVFADAALRAQFAADGLDLHRVASRKK